MFNEQFTNLDALNAKLFKCFLCWYLSRLHHHSLGAQHQGVHGEPFGRHPEWMTVWYCRPWSINHFPTSFDKYTVGLVATAFRDLHQQSRLQECVGGIYMHWVGVIEGENVDIVPVSQVAPHPLNPKAVSHLD